MTNMIRTITDPGEAEAARFDAHEEFLGELEKFDAKHLVTEDALSRWFTPRPQRAREDVIREEYGEPVSVYSIMEERRNL